MSPRVTEVTFTPATAVCQRGGLLGWAAARLDVGLVIDGIAVRRTRGGRMTLSFPARRDRRGRRHFVVRPVDDRARKDLEEQILGQLRRQGRVAS